MKKKNIALLIASVGVISALASCGGEKTTTYTFVVENLVQDGMKGVNVTMTKGDTTYQATTNKYGCAAISAPKGEYTVELSNLPNGYSYNGSLTTTKKQDGYILTLDASLKTGEIPLGTTFKVKDIFYDFTATCLDGSTWNLAEELETHNAVFINMYFKNCGYCQYEAPYVDQAYETYKDDISFLAIDDVDSQADAQAFVDTYNVPFPAVCGKSRLYTAIVGTGANAGYPTTIIVDKFGFVTFRQPGAFMNQSSIDNVLSNYAGEYEAPVVL